MFQLKIHEVSCKVIKIVIKSILDRHEDPSRFKEQMAHYKYRRVEKSSVVHHGLPNLE